MNEQANVPPSCLLRLRVSLESHTSLRQEDARSVGCIPQPALPLVLLWGAWHQFTENMGTAVSALTWRCAAGWQVHGGFSSKSKTGGPGSWGGHLPVWNGRTPGVFRGCPVARGGHSCDWGGSCRGARLLDKGAGGREREGGEVGQPGLYQVAVIQLLSYLSLSPGLTTGDCS